MISSNAVWFQSAGPHYKESLCSICQPDLNQPVRAQPATTWAQLTLYSDRWQCAHSRCTSAPRGLGPRHTFSKDHSVTHWSPSEEWRSASEMLPRSLTRAAHPSCIPPSLIPVIDFINGRRLALHRGAVVKTSRPKNVVFFWAWESNTRGCDGRGRERRQHTGLVSTALHTWVKQFKCLTCGWLPHVRLPHVRLPKASPLTQKRHANTPKYSQVCENTPPPQITACTWPRRLWIYLLCCGDAALKPENQLPSQCRVESTVAH